MSDRVEDNPDSHNPEDSEDSGDRDDADDSDDPDDTVCAGCSGVLSSIEHFCSLYAKRKIRLAISLFCYTEFLLIAEQYGFGDRARMKFEKAWSRVLARMELSIAPRRPVKYRPEGTQFRNNFRLKSIYGVRVLLNPFLALAEVNELEMAFDFVIYRSKVLAPRLPDDNLNWNFRNAAPYMTVFWRLREAVLNYDWEEAGRILGRLPYLRSSAMAPTSLRLYQGPATVHRLLLVPYAVSVFRVGVQRFMQHNIPRELVAKSAADHMLVLMDAGVKINVLNRRNVNLVYLVELLIFVIANGLNEERSDLVKCLSTLPRSSHVPEFAAIMRGYKALAEYECWRLAGCDVAPSNSLSIVDDLVAAVNGVPSGEETVFIDALIHFLGVLELNDALVDVVTDCCQKSPFMVGHCFAVLSLHKLHEEATQLIENVMSASSRLSASDPVWLEWIQPRLLNPQNFQVSSELLSKMCEILFGLLDYGENRQNERAWVFLWACVQRVESDEALREMWRPREEWWPRFHTAPIGDAAALCRLRVLKRLHEIEVQP